MCSINGFISQKPVSKLLAKRLSSALLYYGSVRGNQSAGVYSNGVLSKQAIEPDKFINTSEYAKAFSHDTSLVLGHTRYPTCGDKTSVQAQPFINNGTVTVHNGWYMNMKELKAKWGLVKPSGVDSELVTSFIDSYGVNMLPSFLESTSGPSAIATLYKGELYLAASGNPIAYCTLQVQGNRIMVFASTVDILDRALSYCFLAQRFDIKELEDGFLYKVTPKRVKVMASIAEKKYTFGYDNLDSIMDSYSEVPDSKFYLSREDMIEKIVSREGEEFREMIEVLDEYELEDLMYNTGLVV